MGTGRKGARHIGRYLSSLPAALGLNLGSMIVRKMIFVQRTALVDGTLLARVTGSGGLKAHQVDQDHEVKGSV